MGEHVHDWVVNIVYIPANGDRKLVAQCGGESCHETLTMSEVENMLNDLAALEAENERLRLRIKELEEGLTMDELLSRIGAAIKESSNDRT